MTRLLLALVLATTFMVATPSNAAPSPTTGNDLFEWCSNHAGQGMCLAYILGVTDGMQFMNPAEKKDYCLPAAGTAGQFQDVVKKFVNDHPEERHRSAASVVLIALVVAFPCTDKQ